MAKKYNTLWLILPVLIVAFFYLQGVGYLGIPGVSQMGDIIVKVVDVNNNPVQGAIVYIIPRDNGKIYDILQHRVGYEAKCDSTDENGLCDFGKYNTSVSKQIGVVCPAAFNYSLNSLEYNPVPGSSIGYSVKITCPPNKRENVNDMILRNASVPQEYLSESQMTGKGPACFMDAYIDERCSDFDFGETFYYFNADILSPRGFKVKQCWTQPSWTYGDCLPGEVALGGYCVSQASYFTNLDCGTIKTGYVRVGNFCVAPMPTTTTTILGQTTSTQPYTPTSTTLPTAQLSRNTLNWVIGGVFILILAIVYKRIRK